MNILIADDHELVREGLRLLVKRLAPDAVIYEAGTFRELEVLTSQVADWGLLILDLSMPGTDLLQGVKLVRESVPSAPTVVISGLEETDVIRGVLALGVQGYIPKSASADLMVNAIKLVLSGGRYIPEVILDLPAEDCPVPAGEPDGNANIPGFTRRQSDVALLLTEGKSNKEIGRDLEMSEATVRTHMTAIFRTLKVHNRTQALIQINKLTETG